jgi:hypothetical protein
MTSSKTKVTSVSFIPDLKRIDDNDTHADDPNYCQHMKHCDEKWKRGLSSSSVKTSWKTLTPELVADYIKAFCYDMTSEYKDASAKTLQMVAGVLVKKNLSHFHISLQDIQTKTSFKLESNLLFNDQSFKVLNENETVRFDMEVPLGSKESDIKKRLKEWAETPSVPFIEYDPLASLPNEEYFKLMNYVQSIFEPTGTDDLELLITTASVVLYWKSLESHGGDHSTFTFDGLTNHGVEINPGARVIFKAEAQLLKNILKPEKTSFLKKILPSKKTASASISVFKP